MENTGVQLIRQASAKTNDVAGDGTTWPGFFPVFFSKNRGDFTPPKWMVFLIIMGKPQFLNRWFGGKKPLFLGETPIYCWNLLDNTTYFFTTSGRFLVVEGGVFQMMTTKDSNHFGTCDGQKWHETTGGWLNFCSLGSTWPDGWLCYSKVGGANPVQVKLGMEKVHLGFHTIWASDQWVLVVYFFSGDDTTHL